MSTPQVGLGRGSGSLLGWVGAGQGVHRGPDQVTWPG